MRKHFYRPVDGHGLKHNPFNSIIAPRPIGWISSLSADGIANLAPYSFFNAFNYTPPIIGFSSIGYKDSVKNIEETSEFCWNFASVELADAMNLTCAAVAPDQDEFEFAGLSKGISNEIKAPHVLNSPVVMECRKTQIIPLQTADGDDVDSYLVLGEVVGCHIWEDLIEQGIFSITQANPILRAGGQGDYFTISEKHKMEMPRPNNITGS